MLYTPVAAYILPYCNFCVML